MNRWPTKPLGEVAQVTAGDPAPQRTEDFSDDGVPFVRMQDVGRFGHTTCLIETKDRLSASASPRFKRFPIGSILVPKSGASIRLNHRAVLGIEAHVVSHLAAIVPREAVTSRFAYYWLCGMDLSRIAHQADMPSMKTSELAKLQIPVPPLDEQERIVALLDEADELRKLCAQADRRTADLTPALFHEMFGDPETNPKNLPIVPLGHLLSFRTGKLDSNAAVAEGKYPFFTCSREDFRIDTYAFDCEALLLAGNNAVGAYSVKHYKGKFNAYQRTYVLNLLNPDHSYGFMRQVLQLKLQELKRLSLGTNTKYLTLGILKNIEIPLPDPEPQKEFAERVNEIRAMEAEQAVSRRRLDHLFQAMLHGAFAGDTTI